MGVLNRYRHWGGELLEALRPYYNLVFALIVLVWILVQSFSTASFLGPSALIVVFAYVLGFIIFTVITRRYDETKRDEKAVQIAGAILHFAGILTLALTVEGDKANLSMFLVFPIFLISRRFGPESTVLAALSAFFSYLVIGFLVYHPGLSKESLLEYLSLHLPGILSAGFLFAQAHSATATSRITPIPIPLPLAVISLPSHKLAPDDTTRCY